jgi:hypothetical protein
MWGRSPYPFDLYLVNDTREREMRAPADVRRVPRETRPSVRWSVGQSLIRFGLRLTGDSPSSRPGLT